MIEKATLSDRARFWSWFVEHEKRVRSVRGDDDPALSEIRRHLREYCDGLGFEIGTIPDGSSEFVVTAQGRLEYFAAVARLVENAPAMAGWRAIAFKPCTGFTFVTTADAPTDTKDAHYSAKLLPFLKAEIDNLAVPTVGPAEGVSLNEGSPAGTPLEEPQVGPDQASPATDLGVGGV